MDRPAPKIHHLNADTSWLLQLPIPQEHQKGTRHWFNILIDPWLSGSQSDVASWFSKQWHASKPAVGSIPQVQDLCRQLEQTPCGDDFIDVVAICHEFTDHCHKETLLQVPPTTPVLATTKAATIIQSWKHFNTVLEIPVFGGTQPTDWRKSSLDPLPNWLSISRVQDPKNMLYYHSALMFAFSLDASEAAQAVIYTPHGIQPDPLRQIASAQPPITTLALLHGLHDIAISKAQQLNLGAHNGLSAQRILNAKYWCATHDEQKHGGGLVSWFLRRKVITVAEALDMEKSKADGSAALKDVNFMELGNGDSRVLV